MKSILQNNMRVFCTSHVLPFLCPQRWVRQLALKRIFLHVSEGKFLLEMNWKSSYVQQQSEMSLADLIGRGTAIILKC